MAAEIAHAPAASAGPLGGPAGPAPAGPRPTALTALYVGDLNTDVTESTLYEIFNAVANVTSIRVCRNAVTRESLGYAYVNFQTTADAEKAMAELNYALIKGRACRIQWSQRDPSVRRSNVGNVFVKNLGPDITTKELHETFKLFGNILSCKVAADGKGVSKGYGFVHFETDKAAQAAIEGINGMEWDGRNVVVTTYVPRTQRTDPEWTNLFVKNIPSEWNEKALVDAFAPFGEVMSSVLQTDEAGKSRGFGFVCFGSHTAAKAAEEALNGKEVDGTPASVPPFKAKDGETAAPAAPAATGGKLRLFVGRAQKKAERERSKKDAQDAARRERQQKWAGCNLYVRNLDESVDDALLRKEFAKFGSVTSAVVARDKEGRSRLFGYVCLGSQDEASKALSEMHRKMLQGKPLHVQLWQPKEARAATMANLQRGGPRGPVPTAAPGAGLINPALAAVLANPAAMAARGAAPADVAQLQQLLAFMFMAAQNQNRMGVPGSVPPTAGGRPGVPPGGVPIAAGPGAGGRPGFQPQVPGFGFPPQQFMQMLAAGALNPQVVAAANVAANSAAARAAQRKPTGPAVGGPVPGGVPARGPSAAAVAAGASPLKGAAPSGVAPRSTGKPGAQYVNAARNVADVPSEHTAAVGVPIPMAAPAAPVQAPSFATQLASAAPEARKHMIGERLFSQIVPREPERAAKITGMLLEAMDEGELLHLLESPADLASRISEALGVLGAAPKK